MTTYTDPDTSVIRAHRGAGSSARINDTSGHVSTTSGKVAGATDGKGPERLTGDAVTIGQALAGLATDAAISTDVWGDLNKAVDAWDASAPKAEEMNAAEKAVTDAQTACTAANEKADAAPDDKDLAKKADDAGEALIKAKQHLIDLQRERKAAVKALLEAIGRAITKAKRISGATIPGKDGDSGRGTPGTGSGTQSSGAPAAAKPGGTSAGTPAAKPSGTPAATPASTAPSTKTSSDVETAALAATLAGQQSHNGQQPQAQQAAQQMPSMPQVPQQANQQNGKDKGGTAEEKPLGDKLAEAALGGSPSAVLSSFGSTPSPSSHPSVPAPVAQPSAPRPEFKPASLTATPVAQTTGTSQTGLHTTSDVGGRSTPSATAFSATPTGAETKTSGAHGTETAQQGQQQRTTGTGLPPGGMVPAAGAVGAPATGTGSRQGGEEPSKILRHLSDEQRLLNGEDSLAESTPYTIAQNKPDRPNAA